MASAIFSEAFEKRAAAVAPWVHDEGYFYESAGMRRERFIHCLEYGSSCLTRALESVVS